MPHARHPGRGGTVRRDEHVLRLIEKSPRSQLFVSLYGNPDSSPNRQLKERSQAIAASPPPIRSLQIHFYDADSSKVWREQFVLYAVVFVS
jgi:hypothetical protein